ncbi:MAG: hypothetical protein U0903_22030 [Planctomycetales bacterium]
MAHRILIIDDNPQVHQVFRDVLGRPNSLTARIESLPEALFGEKTTPIRDEDFVPKYSLDHVLDGEEGVRLFREANHNGWPHKLAFVDLAETTMGWDGIRTIEELWAISDNLRVVIASSHAELYEREFYIRLRRHRKLVMRKKPIDGIEIATLAEALCADQLSDNDPA